MILLPIALIAIIAFLFFSTYKNKQKRARLLDELRSNWGKPLDSVRHYRLITAYSKHLDDDVLAATLAADIDLEKLFEYVDRANSKPGQQYLYARLRKPERERHKLLDFDQLIEQVGADDAKREAIMMELQRLNNPDAYYIHQLFHTQAVLLYDAILKLYVRFAGILWVAALALTIVLHNQFLFFLTLGFTMFNFYIHFTNKEKIYGFVHSLPQLRRMISVANNIGNIIQTAGYKGSQNATAQLKKLNRKLAYVSLESGISNDPTDLGSGIWELFKILLLIEPRAFINVIDEVNFQREPIEVLFNYVAEIDAAVSVQSLRAGLPYYCKPNFVNGSDELKIDELYHPLIYNCVPNSLLAKHSQGVLITGSNMSGKTTFIRSVAVNTLLTQTLYTSPSKSYQAPLLDICSSINMTDSLDESKSYFQAEALSIFNILNHVKETGGNCLVIIDEIFRGTNTIERVAAAKAILSYLSANKTFVFVSTHDLELAELLGDEYAVYSFEEMAADERLIFDYKIKPGILKHKNAIAVLKAIGYPESVINNANKVSEELGKKYN
ncbi:MutS-related protein [Mucilaginibacter agri]|uniref:DNA mismatch repair proteins mutS family domain-containing protein n=1 Tax=Mucilaginibacter agri TaxID=2695265 RepID=A0A965ZLM7_9SPHI|nr:hypothetical protein [Mucilaginibacter agri]NCD71871.1 hypothetical protein [Mucilaginibacter agri]